MPLLERDQLTELRRFARTLAGTRDAGDALVAAFVDALIAAPDRLPAASSRADHYRLLLQVAPDAVPDDAPLVPPPHRLAMLLVCLEALTEAEAAHVLAVDPPDLRALLECGGAEIARQKPAAVLIVHDEAFVALELESILACAGHRIVDLCRSEAEALRRVRADKPDLVLVATMQLPDGDGLDLIRALRAPSDPPVVAFSAYPPKWLAGRGEEPVFITRKPFTSAQVLAIAAQALWCARRRSFPEATL